MLPILSHSVSNCTPHIVLEGLIFSFPSPSRCLIPFLLRSATSSPPPHIPASFGRLKLPCWGGPVFRSVGKERVVGKAGCLFSCLLTLSTLLQAVSGGGNGRQREQQETQLLTVMAASGQLLVVHSMENCRKRKNNLFFSQSQLVRRGLKSLSLSPVNCIAGKSEKRTGLREMSWIGVGFCFVR